MVSLCDYRKEGNELAKGKAGGLSAFLAIGS